MSSRSAALRDDKSVTVSLRGEPLITVVGNWRDILTQGGLLDNSTLRRRGLRLATTASAVLPVSSRLVGQPVLFDVVQELSSAIRIVAAEEGVEIGSLCIMWPYGHRRNRTYVTALDAFRQPKYFAKISNTQSDRSQLNHEHDVLKRFAVAKPFGWKLPESRGVREDGSRTALVMTALPGRRQSLDWSQIRAMLPLREHERGPHIGFAIRAAQSLTWFRVAPKVHNRKFADLLKEVSERPIRCGLAHGDIRGNNIARVDDSYWLLDWETSSNDAPALTDAISHLANAPRTFRRRQDDRPRRQMLLREADLASYNRGEVALAVYYLASQGDREARQMIDAWE